MACWLICVAKVALAQPPSASASGEQPAATVVAISGRVIDALGQPIRGATVTVEGVPISVQTDRGGRYHVDRAAVGAPIAVSHDGFETGAGTVNGTVIDDIVLLTTAQTETIEIRGESPPDAPGATRIDRSDIQRVPGAGGDVARTLTAMPGVVNTQLPTGLVGSLFLNGPPGIIIRGSAPQDSKILIDDFEVPLLYHLIGFRAILPAEAVSTLDYVPGGFDVAYGRAGAGIVVLTTRAGGDQRTEQAEISALDGGALAQGPAAEGTQYMIALRRSTIDLILPNVIPSSANLSLTTVPYYYDLQARIDHRLTSSWKLALSAIGSDDELSLFRDKAKNADKQFLYQTEFLRITASARYNKGPWSAVVALSEMLEEFHFQLSGQFTDTKRVDNALRGELTRTASELAGLRDVVWRIGGEVDVSRYHLDLALPAAAPNGIPPTQPPSGTAPTTNRFDGIVWTPDFAAWIALTASLDPRIRVTTSLRIDGFARSGDTAIQPRGELDIKLADKTSARLSAGAYRRPGEFQQELLDAHLHPERDTQVIAGVEHEPRPGFRIQTSVYYTDRTDLITQNANGQFGNEGRGTTYGAELLATLRDGPWFAWLSYAYSHSTRIDYPGAAERLFEFDQPHSLNASASWKHGKWQLGARFEIYSGLPYTPVVGSVFNTDTNGYTPIYGKPDSLRAPFHDQLDMRIDRTWHIGSLALTGFIDVQNVYLNASVTGYGHNYDYSQQFAFKSLPIIPSIGVRGVL